MRWRVSGSMWMLVILAVFTVVTCNQGGVTTGPTLPLPSGGRYVGADTCKNCHQTIYDEVQTTRHSQALTSLQQIGFGTNSECLSCHTLGYGFESGFKDATSTPGLGGVQCENCHGPGEQHVSSGGDKTKILTYPGILAASLCGKCHTDAHHPTYDEWEVSSHTKVTEHVAGYLADPVNGPARLVSCGPCHSGDYRVMVMENALASPNLVGKTREEMTAQTCAVCHDPHKATGNNAAEGEEAQLRHKEYWDPEQDPYQGGDSTDINVYSRIDQVCGQCHNRRGADPTDAGLAMNTSRAAHYSVQLDFLLGLGGVEDGGSPALSEHRFTPRQCATCHVSMKEYESEDNPAITGHTFRIRLEGCSPCHSISDAAARMLNTKSDIEAKLATLKNRLDAWGVQANIQGKGALSWEYSSYGGPSSGATGQDLIPIQIKRARYNYYYVEHDGSFGVHNAKYARYLLLVANQQLDALGVP